MSFLRVLRDAGGLWLLKTINRGLRALTSATHRVQMLAEWGIRPHPEWFDHFIDQYHGWRKSRTPFCWERGIFNLLAMEPGANVLELCCGDGFNAHHFYSIRAANIYSVDFDPKAIAHARRHFGARNVSYNVLDIRGELPHGPFDNIIWDAAIEHFTETEIATVLANIRKRLKPAGVLSGYTILEEAHEQHHDHEYEFKSKDDLARVLKPHFKNVLVWQTNYPTRRNLYFYASDLSLPFDREWQHAVRP